MTFVAFPYRDIELRVADDDLSRLSRLKMAVKNLARAIATRVSQRDNSRRWIYTHNKVTLARDATGARYMEM